MNTYKTHGEIKKAHSDEFNQFEGIFFAFNNSQFEEGMKKLGLTMDDTDKICSLGSGGYMLKSRKQDLADMWKRHDLERKEFRKDQKHLLDSLVYELNNHEFCITGSVDDALDALGLELSEIDPKLLKKACRIALAKSSSFQPYCAK